MQNVGGLHRFNTKMWSSRPFYSNRNVVHSATNRFWYCLLFKRSAKWNQPTWKMCWIPRISCSLLFLHYLFLFSGTRFQHCPRYSLWNTCRYSYTHKGTHFFCTHHKNTQQVMQGMQVKCCLGTIWRRLEVNLYFKDHSDCFLGWSAFFQFYEFTF